MQNSFFRICHALLAGVALVCLTGPAAAVDLLDVDGNGMSDLWEQIYNATTLDPNGDEDDDGCSNLVEALAGTDPWDPTDCHMVGEVTIAGGQILFIFKSKLGKEYQIYSADSPVAPDEDWSPDGDPVLSDEENKLITISRPMPVGDDSKFYRLESRDVDRDNDGVNDWAEGKTGTNPTSGTPSPNNASHGQASDLDSLRSLLSVTVSTVDPDAFETHSTLGKKPAMVRLSRTFNPGAGIPLFVPFDTAGGEDAEKGSASGGDFELKVGGVGVGGNEIPFPMGTTNVDVEVDPMTDSDLEVPERLRIRCWAGAPGASQPLGEGAVQICDADPVDENRRLYVAFLGREAGVVTTATGIATALVEGDNDSARVSVTFSNLSSNQNTTYIRVGSDLDVKNIPLGQASNILWQIRAAHFYTTDQDMLNALANGNCYIDITTDLNVGGEITGIFQSATGSEAPPTPPAPPAIGDPEFPDLAGFDLDRDIHRFMMQATFGPTTDLYNQIKAHVDTAKGGGGTYIDGLEAWIDEQMDLGQTPSPSWMRLTMAADLEEHLIRNCAAINDNNDPQFGGNAFIINSNGSTPVNNIDNNNRPNHINRRREWWTLVTQCRDQLRQRMAQALTEICVISENDGVVRDRHYGATHYWDQMAAGAFGKYRDILEDVTYSPMMGVYLSHLKNRKASGSVFPDENYAREIMQLFTIGLVLRHDDGSLVLGSNGLPIPTYDQTDITELAKVMTGLSFSRRHRSISAPRYPNPQNQRIGTLENNGNFGEGNGHRYWQGQWMNPMWIFSGEHDYTQKVLFAGKVGEKTIPARGANRNNGNLDLRDAHNALAGNPSAATYDASGGHPNTPVFISRLLIQRFVTANPSAGYLHRVTQAYKSTNGNLGAVVKAILLDYEARSLDLADQIGSGKPKETLLHYTAVLRALKTKSGIPLSTIRTDQLTPYMPSSWTADTPSKYVPDVNPFPQSEYDKFPANSYRLRQNDTNNSLGMAPLRAPSVFNWFLPDYVVPGALAQAGLVSPELQIMTDSQVVNNINALWSLTWSSTSLQTNAPTIVGFGGDNIFNIHRYQDANGVQIPIPKIVLDRGYRTPGTQNGWVIGVGLDTQLDRMKPDFTELYNLYDSTYDAERAGGASNNVAHDRAGEAVLDKVDLWFCAGYLKHRWGATPNVASPRKSMIDFINSLGKPDKPTNTSYNNNVVNRVRYLCYLVSISPQGLVLR
jgi:uncharacterized protein (DUF1800 family)